MKWVEVRVWLCMLARPDAFALSEYQISCLQTVLNFESYSAPRPQDIIQYHECLGESVLNVEPQLVLA